MSRIERLAPLAALLALALVIAGGALSGETPDPDEGVAKAVEFWRDDDDKLMLGAVLFALAAVPYLWFVGSLRATLRQVEGATGRLSAVAFGGGVIFAAAMAVSAGLQFALADAAEHLSPDAVHTLSALNYGFFFPFAVGLSLLLLATGVLAVRTGVLPGWLGWVTIVLGLAAITPAGFFAFVASGLWLIVVSVLLYRRGSTPPPVPGAPG